MKKYDIFYIITFDETEFERRMSEETAKRGIGPEDVISLGGGAFTTAGELEKMEQDAKKRRAKRRMMSRDREAFVKVIEDELANREYVYSLDELGDKEDILAAYGYRLGNTYAEGCFKEAEENYLERVF